MLKLVCWIDVRGCMTAFPNSVLCAKHLSGREGDDPHSNTPEDERNQTPPSSIFKARRHPIDLRSPDFLRRRKGRDSCSSVEPVGEDHAPPSSALVNYQPVAKPRKKPTRVFLKIIINCMQFISLSPNSACKFDLFGL
jgi:hypothetical protein